MFFSPLSSFIPLSLTSTLSLRLPLLVSLDVQWWPVCGGSQRGKVMVVMFFPAKSRHGEVVPWVHGDWV